MDQRHLSYIYLYDGGKTESLNLEKIVQYLGDTFGKVEVQIRDEFLASYLSSLQSEKRETAVKEIAETFACSKVCRLNNRNLRQKPLIGEIDYEKRRILNPDSKSLGILYDGFKLAESFLSMIPESESNFRFCHIVFTNQLFGTWDENDCRWHARVSIYGFPSIISTTGIVEAPAKPREFYLKRQAGIDNETLKKEFSGRFIDYGDRRLTEIMKGYVMQAVFYHMTGDPFCDDRDCRLYNAHWQEEVIQAQLNSRHAFCQKHKEILNDKFKR